MRVLLVGASGTIGRAVAAALGSRHEVVQASRRSALAVDISDPASISGMYARVGLVDAVVCCAGQSRRGPLDHLTDDDFQSTFRNKILAQINVVRLGVASVRDHGSFTLTAGAYSRYPIAGVAAMAMANGALESFARAAALDLPRGVRINVVSPPLLRETAATLGMTASVTAGDLAISYVRFVEGSETGLVGSAGGQHEGERG